MKNLQLRFVLAGLVTGFTYLAFLTTIPIPGNAYENPTSTLKMLTEGQLDDSLSVPVQEEQVRKLNYGKFRTSLLRHRSIYYT